MIETTPLHYELRDTPLFGDSPMRIVRNGITYIKYPVEHIEPQIAADEAVNRLKIGMDTPDQRRAVEAMRPIIEAEFGVRPQR